LQNLQFKDKVDNLIEEANKSIDNYKMRRKVLITKIAVTIIFCAVLTVFFTSPIALGIGLAVIILSSSPKIIKMAMNVKKAKEDREQSRKELYNFVNLNSDSPDQKFYLKEIKFFTVAEGRFKDQKYQAIVVSEYSLNPTSVQYNPIRKKWARVDKFELNYIQDFWNNQVFSEENYIRRRLVEEKGSADSNESGLFPRY
jgi:hypothetical protein